MLAGLTIQRLGYDTSRPYRAERNVGQIEVSRGLWLGLGLGLG
jgi:hypothetical protein